MHASVSSASCSAACCCSRDARRGAAPATVNVRVEGEAPTRSSERDRVTTDGHASSTRRAGAATPHRRRASLDARPAATSAGKLRRASSATPRLHGGLARRATSTRAARRPTSAAGVGSDVDQRRATFAVGAATTELPAGRRRAATSRARRRAVDAPGRSTLQRTRRPAAAARPAPSRVTVGTPFTVNGRRAADGTATAGRRRDRQRRRRTRRPAPTARGRRLTSNGSAGSCGRRRRNARRRSRARRPRRGAVRRRRATTAPAATRRRCHRPRRAPHARSASGTTLRARASAPRALRRHASSPTPRACRHPPAADAQRRRPLPDVRRHARALRRRSSAAAPRRPLVHGRRPRATSYLLPARLAAAATSSTSRSIDKAGNRDDHAGAGPQPRGVHVR